MILGKIIKITFKLFSDFFKWTIFITYIIIFNFSHLVNKITALVFFKSCEI